MINRPEEKHVERNDDHEQDAAGDEVVWRIRCHRGMNAMTPSTLSTTITASKLARCQ